MLTSVRVSFDNKVYFFRSPLAEIPVMASGLNYWQDGESKAQTKSNVKKMKKINYVLKAFALFKMFKSYNLTNNDIAKAGDLSGNLRDKTEEFKIILDMAKDTIGGKYQMNKLNLGIIVGTIVYVISPLDAIPDLAPVVGWLDDVTIIGFALSKLKAEVLKYQAWTSLQTAKS